MKPMSKGNENAPMALETFTRQDISLDKRTGAQEPSRSVGPCGRPQTASCCVVVDTSTTSPSADRSLSSASGARTALLISGFWLARP